MTLTRGAVGCFFFQAEAGIRAGHVTGVQTCALPIFAAAGHPGKPDHRARLRRRPGPGQAPDDGRGRRLAGRRGHPHQRQPAFGGPAGHSRGDAGRRAERAAGRARPGDHRAGPRRGHRAGRRGGLARRRGRGGGQGPRDRPVRGRGGAAVRRPPGHRGRPGRADSGARTVGGEPVIPLSLARIAQITGGRLCHGDPEAVVSGEVVIDSRRAGAGGLFAAVAGERSDGHDFAAAAVAAGAVAVLATRPVPVPSVLVADVPAALAALARSVVDALPEAQIAGLTGSSGKTSTKDLAAQLVERLGPTIAPAGSYNNEFGHPLTVLRADAATRYLVLELSARGIGHIAYLCRVAPPRYGVVLNVGHAHAGEFGGLDQVARAKGELVEALPADGVAILNADDPRVLAMAERTGARVVTFSSAPGSDAPVRAADIRLDELGR